jgi:TrmH family RNA methyltransferase
MTKNELKYFSSLLKKKYRDTEKKFLAEGIKVIREGTRDSAWRKRCEKVFVTNIFLTQHDDFIKELNHLGIEPEVINEQELSRLSDTVTPQGAAAIFSMPGNIAPPAGQLSRNLSVVLENISDPGNAGAIIRNCDWFGIKDIILSPGCADIYNPKTIRSCMGSLFHLNIYDNIDLTDFLNGVRTAGTKILCADLNGQDVFKYELQKPSVIIFSNEASGPSEEILKLSDDIITIKKIGDAESLNVASASAVILAELTRTD